jgi:hypothetical protein
MTLHHNDTNQGSNDDNGPVTVKAYAYVSMIAIELNAVELLH